MRSYECQQSSVRLGACIRKPRSLRIELPQTYCWIYWRRNSVHYEAVRSDPQRNYWSLYNIIPKNPFEMEIWGVRTPALRKVGEIIECRQKQNKMRKCMLHYFQSIKRYKAVLHKIKFMKIEDITSDYDIKLQHIPNLSLKFSNISPT